MVADILEQNGSFKMVKKITLPVVSASTSFTPHSFGTCVSDLYELTVLIMITPMVNPSYSRTLIPSFPVHVELNA
jgi:hypothetical protein